VPWLLDCPATTSFQKSPIFTQIYEVWSAQISEFRCTGKKIWSIFDPANSGLTLPPSPLSVWGSACIWGVENTVSSLYFANIHTEMSQNTHSFCAVLTGFRLEGKEPPKKSGFKNTQKKRKICRQVQELSWTKLKLLKLKICNPLTLPITIMSTL
jgi:hypothetical protein